MTHRLRPLVALALLVSACSGVDAQLEGLQGRVDDVSDRARFCFAVTRALTAVDGGSSPAEAQEAAEEVLTQVPDELREDAELVADRLRRAAGSGDGSALDATFRAAAERLRDGTRERCTPTG